MGSVGSCIIKTIVVQLSPGFEFIELKSLKSWESDQRKFVDGSHREENHINFNGTKNLQQSLKYLK